MQDNYINMQDNYVKIQDILLTFNIFVSIMLIQWHKNNLIEIIPGLAPVYWYVATLGQCSDISVNGS